MCLYVAFSIGEGKYPSLYKLKCMSIVYVSHATPSEMVSYPHLHIYSYNKQSTPPTASCRYWQMVYVRMNGADIAESVEKLDVTQNNIPIRMI